MKYVEKMVIGAGVTGVFAARSIDAPIYEKRGYLGGKCASYFLKRGDNERFFGARPENSFLFEQGGGHWVWVNDEDILQRLKDKSNLVKYYRKAAVYFTRSNKFIPYPIQYNLKSIDHDLRIKILNEITDSANNDYEPLTLEESLKHQFGDTLCDKFFYPFHRLYTKNLYKIIKPNESYKTPFDLKKIWEGAEKKTQKYEGYNYYFYYPYEGLYNLLNNCASDIAIKYYKEAVSVDVHNKIITFNDGEKIGYKYLISSIPLSKLMNAVDFSVDEKEDPYVSTLVLNMAGVKGENYPPYHWLYSPDSKSGFYRVGFYSNVSKNFLASNVNNAASSYVEKSYLKKPTEKELKKYCNMVCDELVSMGFFESIDVIDPTWIDVAYTWSRYDSNWVDKSVNLLKKHDIFSVGRYGVWRNQGIMDSIIDGVNVKSIIKEKMSGA
jgi:protoporphyrinogen oxidase